MVSPVPVREKILLAWSGGKDSALSLYEITRKQEFEILALLTTITRDYDRVSMHGVRRVLLEQQAAAAGFALEQVYIPANSSNQEYESRMKEALAKYHSRGITGVAFGDIFLEDLRKYREKRLSELGLRGIFPLWRQETAELARAFIAEGFRAVTASVDHKFLDQSFVGREFDHQFLSDLPKGVDPCGENGEFHSFVYAGPIFNKTILVQKGEVVFRENRFYYCDLSPLVRSSP